MKKLAIVLAAAMLVSAVIAGCGNNGQAAGEETAAETQTQAAEAETETKESILEKDENGNFIKPDNYGEVVKLGKYNGLEVTLKTRLLPMKRLRPKSMRRSKVQQRQSRWTVQQ